MIFSLARSEWLQTSASGAMAPAAMIALISLSTAEHATANTYDKAVVPNQTRTASSPWLVNPKLSTVETATSAILEIRRLSGLTWEGLAGLFGVTRRSVHHWASGKPVNAVHDQDIRKVLTVVRLLDRGDSAQTRNLLLDPEPKGVSILDLLKKRDFEEAITRASVHPRHIRPKLTSLVPAEQRRRKPPSPGLLVDALQDRPHIEETARPDLSARLPKTTRKSQG